MPLTIERMQMSFGDMSELKFTKTKLHPKNVHEIVHKKNE